MSLNSANSFIFDLDDTLCTYDINVEEALKHAFNEAGFSPVLSEEDLDRGFKEEFERELKSEDRPEKGFRKRVFSNLLEGKDTFSEGDIGNIGENFRKIREENLVLFEDVLEVLDRISKKKKLGLLTNGPSSLQWRKIEILDLADNFDVIVVSGDRGISKPDPRVFLHTLDKMNEKPENSVYIGNSIEYDLRGAKKTGMKMIWVDHGVEELSEDDPNPDLIVNHPRELEDLDLGEKLSCQTRRTK